jgi:hypothetical protein
VKLIEGEAYSRVIAIITREQVSPLSLALSFSQRVRFVTDNGQLIKYLRCAYRSRARARDNGSERDENPPIVRILNLNARNCRPSVSCTTRLLAP